MNFFAPVDMRHIQEQNIRQKYSVLLSTFERISGPNKDYADVVRQIMEKMYDAELRDLIYAFEE